MSRSAAYWRWHASVSDSVRHELVERAWFDREVTKDIDTRDMPGLKPPEESVAVQIIDLYGQPSPEPLQEPEPEP